MMGAMDRADTALRTLLLEKKPNRMALLVLAVLTALASAVISVRLPLCAELGMLVRAQTALLLAVPVLLLAMFALRAVCDQEGGVVFALLACGITLCAFAARVTFFGQVSSDFEIYLSDWMDKLAAGSFAQGMRANIGEYNVLYQYILFLLTRTGIPALYGVKAVSLIGDALLCGAVSRLAGREGKRSLCALTLCALLPGFVLNGGMFAQCDSLYASCALWGLALALDKKPARAAACFALSLAFKLQACFLLPIVCVLWADRKLRLCDAGVFVLTLCAVSLPALLGGKSVAQIISIYLGQTGLYTGLTYNAPGFFGLMETAGLDVYAYGKFGMALAFGCLMLLLFVGAKQAGRLTADGYAYLSFLMVLSVVFFLPRMHERYFYMADALAVVLAVRDRRMIPVLALTALSTLSRLWVMPVSLPMASDMMLTAGVLAVMGAKSALNNMESML